MIHAFLIILYQKGQWMLFFFSGWRGCLLLNVCWVIPCLLFLESSHSCNASLTLNVCATFPYISIRLPGRRDCRVKVKNEVSRSENLNHTETRHKTTIFLLLVGDLIWLDKTDLFAILFFYLMVWYWVWAPSRGNGREELPWVSSAQGFIFAKPQNGLRVKNILHCLTCRLLEGSTQYFCLRGNETKYRETQETLWVTPWNTKHRIVFKTYINHLLLPGREIGITTMLLLKKPKNQKNKKND